MEGLVKGDVHAPHKIDGALNAKGGVTLVGIATNDRSAKENRLPCGSYHFLTRRGEMSSERRGKSSPRIEAPLTYLEKLGRVAA